MSETNEEQKKTWNNEQAVDWIAWKEPLEWMLRSLTDSIISHAGLKGGERVLDVGCGCGDTMLDLLARVGMSGNVTGIDISEPMLQVALNRVRNFGYTNYSLINNDAQTVEFPEQSFDLVFSRLGIMFFEDPVSAFKQFHKALKPGGRIEFVAWQDADKNEWIREPQAAVAKVIQLPDPEPPRSPGLFAFADPDYVREILEAAGFANIDIDPLESTFTIAGGSNIDKAIHFMEQVSPLRHTLEGLSEPQRNNALLTLTDCMRSHMADQGVRMGYAAWHVRAEKPA